MNIIKLSNIITQKILSTYLTRFLKECPKIILWIRILIQKLLITQIKKVNSIIYNQNNVIFILKN